MELAVRRGRKVLLWPAFFFIRRAILCYAVIELMDRLIT